MSQHERDKAFFDDGITRREFVAGAVTVAGAAALPLAVSPTAVADDATSALPSDAAANLTIQLKVNGKQQSVLIDSRTSLLDALRERLNMSGTKKGCDHGQCGACTVHVNGQRVLSCLTLAASVDGDEVTTIEGIANGDELHPIQAAFIKHDALQCGYCTPGQIMSAVALIKEGHAKTEDEVREQMSGNLCRCGAYPNICKAVMETMKA